jgi:hypothetical protein
MYRINWKSLETEATGHGEPVFKTVAMAKKTADNLTEESPFMVFWVTGPHPVYPKEEDNDNA